MYLLECAGTRNVISLESVFYVAKIGASEG